MLEEHIDRLTADVDFHSTGQMQIDLTSAIDKLAYGIDHHPDLILTKLCAGLLSLGGEEIWIRNFRTGLLIAVKNPQRDWWPAAVSELALGKHGKGLKPLGIALLALRPHVRNMGWIRWGEKTEVLPLAPGIPSAPKNPWKDAAATGLWLEGKLTGFRLKHKLYEKVASQLYHAPLVIRWNRYTLGIAARESLEQNAESEYHCLHLHEDGLLAARPRSLAVQECWGSLPYLPLKTTLAEPHKGSIRWVDAPPQVIFREGRGNPLFPEMIISQKYRFSLGSLVICFHSDPSQIFPVHHGELLESVKVDEAFPQLQKGVTLYAPADSLATDLTHSSLLEDESFRAWRERILQRASQAIQRITQADEEMEKVKDARSRMLWFHLRRRHTAVAPATTGESEGNSAFALSGLFGLSSQGITVHRQDICLGHWLMGSTGDRHIALWIQPNQALFPLWTGLEEGRLPLSSASNPFYDLLHFCLKPPTVAQAVRLIEWSEGREIRSWTRDPLNIFRELPKPLCQSGLTLQIFESGRLGSLEDSLIAFYPGKDGVCQIWNWRDLKKDPDTIRAERQQTFYRVLGKLLVFAMRRTQRPVPHDYQAFAPTTGQIGFTLELGDSIQAQFQGQLHKTGWLRCAMAYLPAASEDFTRLFLYRFGSRIELSYLDLQLPVREIWVDATDWDLTRPPAEMLEEHGWLKLLA